MKQIIKDNKWQLVVTSLVILLPILIGLVLWQRLPDEIPTHFGADGKADDYSSKEFAVFGLPAFLLAIHWLCILGTSADPKKQNIPGKMLGIVLWICPVISMVVCSGCYAYAMGVDINISMISLLLVGVGFVIIGNYLPKCRQSYTVGIKLPWTLADEGNWNATHRLAGKLWCAMGLVLLGAAAFTAYTEVIAVILLVVLGIGAILPCVYSYVYYRRHPKSADPEDDHGHH